MIISCDSVVSLSQLRLLGITVVKIPPGLDLANKFGVPPNKVWMLKFQFFFFTAETFKVVHAQLATEVRKAGNGN